MRTLLRLGIGGFREELQHARPMALSTLVTIVLGYLSLALSARLLSATDFGLLGALLGIVAVVSVALRPLHTMATHYAADALSSRKPENVAIATAWITLGVVVAAVVLSIGAVALRDELQATLRAQTFAPVAVLTPLLCGTALWQITSGHLMGLRRFRAFAVASIIDAVIRTILTAPLVSAWGVAGSLTSYTTGVLMASAVGMRLSGGLVWRGRPSFMTQQIARIGGASVILTMVVAVLQNLDLVTLRTYSDPDLVGLYAGSAALGNVWFAVAAPIYLPLYSRLRAAYLAGNETTHLMVGTLVPIAAGGLTASLVSIPLGVPAASLLLGASLGGSGVYLPLYLAKTTALLILFVFGQYALATDRSQLVAFSAIPGVVCVGLLVAVHPEPILAPLYGLGGAAAGAVPAALALMSRSPRGHRFKVTGA
jgi:O-antigen/teichoic acid export membrane protein